MTIKISNCCARESKRELVFALWIALTIVALIYSVVKIVDGKVSADLGDLLPNTEISAILPGFDRTLQESVARNVVFAVRDNRAFVEQLDVELKKDPMTESVVSSFDAPRQKKMLDEWFADRLASLSPDDKAFYLTASPETIGNKVLAQIYSPVSTPTEKELKDDPYLLGRTVLKSQAVSSFGLKDGFITAKDETGNLWYLVTVRLRADEPSAEREQWANRMRTLLANAQAKDPNLQVRFAGAVFHAAEAARSAKQDMTTLSSVSLVLLLALFWLTFGSLKPMVLCALSVSAGLVFGLAATFLVFGSVHVITLVMSVSLLGISTDYTVHYWMARVRAPCGESSFETLRKLRRPLLQALTTTVLAYTLMLFAPFAGLRQLGVFATFGLTASFLTVAIVFPFLMRAVRPSPWVDSAHLGEVGDAFGTQDSLAPKNDSDRSPSLGLKCLATFRYLQNFCRVRARDLKQSRARRIKRILQAGFIFAILAAAAVSLPRLQISDDMFRWHQSSAFLQDSEALIRALTQKHFSQSGLIVVADDDETLARRLEELNERIRSDHAISPRGYLLPNILSESSQTALIDRLRSIYPQFSAQMEANGLEKTEFSAPSIVSLHRWLNSETHRQFEPFFFTVGAQKVFFVPIEVDAAQLTKLSEGLSGVYPHHFREAIERQFGRQRALLMKTAAFLICGFLILFGIFFGWKKALLQTSVVVLSCTAALSALAFSGMPFNLFSVFALILILGIGADYQIFSAQSNGRSVSIFWAITVSALTTVISLGVLVLSQTEIIRNFGLIVCIGIFTAYAFVPLFATICDSQEANECRNLRETQSSSRIEP